MDLDELDVYGSVHHSKFIQK